MWSVFRLRDSQVSAPRADAVRNRAALVEAATRVFASSAEEPSMRAIAREAGVGIATLYRHFPTRESLVDAVYRDQVQRLTRGARELLRHHSPVTAMRKWMDLFGQWLVTKHGMLDTLRDMIDTGQLAHAETHDELLAAITLILDAGAAAGELRADVGAEDVAASILGVFTVAGRPGQHAQLKRLLDLLMDGLKARSYQGETGDREKGDRRPSA